MNLVEWLADSRSLFFWFFSQLHTYSNGLKLCRVNLPAQSIVHISTSLGGRNSPRLISSEVRGFCFNGSVLRRTTGSILSHHHESRPPRHLHQIQKFSLTAISQLVTGQRYKSPLAMLKLVWFGLRPSNLYAHNMHLNSFPKLRPKLALRDRSLLLKNGRHLCGNVSTSLVSTLVYIPYHQE